MCGRLVIEIGEPGIARQRLEILLDRAAGGLVHHQVQAGVAVQQGIAETAHQRQRGGYRGKAERPGERRGNGRHGLRHAAHRAQDLLRPGQHRLALRRQADEAPVALDQPLAQVLLQRGEPGRQRRLRHAAFRRRAREMAVMGQRHEIAQVAQLHGPGKLHRELRDRFYHASPHDPARKRRAWPAMTASIASFPWEQGTQGRP
jgi:hypothetical protein